MTDAVVARRWWAILLSGGLVGIVAAATQVTERISALKSGTGFAVCEINDVISCGKVAEHWQASALGIPNSLVSLPIFGILTATGLAGLLGTRFARAYVGFVLGLTLFMTAFVTWFMEQTAYAIGAMCIFCTAGAVGLLIAGIGITRVGAAYQAFGTGRVGRILDRLVASGADLAFWIGLAAIIATMLVTGLSIA
jgi:uncharacterized membrane protein